jgi:exopolyphosphatase / guanosine-5'-triphosphate,3'-diphosphate pyrophosphatase
MILAGIDIGTNTLRLLVAETGPDSFQEIYSDRRITRLGQDLDRSGSLSRDAEERSLSALHDFTEQIRRYAPAQISAIGTSALRKASNSSAFIGKVKDRTGLDISVISGEEEARLTLLGVARAVAGAGGQGKGDLLKAALVIDIGGGSTEIIMTGSRPSPFVVSLPLGAVYLTERFINHDPPTGQDIDLLRRAVEDALETGAGMIKPDPACVFIGTAGTITTLAAIDQGLAVYDPERINRSVLTRDALDDMVHKLSALTVAKRRTIRGLEQGREDIILAGAVVTQAIMRRFRYTSMLVSDWGLREGIVLDLYENIRRGRAPRETHRA